MKEPAQAHIDEATSAETRRSAPLAAIFLDGEYPEPAYFCGWAEGAGLIVAADGGARFLLDQGITADLVVGDFDSLAAGDVARLEAAGVELIRHPVRKDRTDGEMAVDEALRRGAGEVVLAGALGALDHTLGHLAILRRVAARGIVARLVAPRLVVRVFLAPDDAYLDASPGTRVSLVPLQGDALVSLRGFDYGLERGLLPRDSCLGLGNAVSADARILVHEGEVAVLVADGREAFAGAHRQGVTAS